MRDTPKLTYSAIGASLTGTAIGVLLLLCYSASYKLQVVGLFLTGTILVTHLVWKWVSITHSLLIGWITASSWFSPLLWHCFLGFVAATVLSFSTILLTRAFSSEQAVSSQQRPYFLVASLLLSFLFPSALALLHALRQHVWELNAAKKRIVQMENRALRAQMNPHFLVNSLNGLLLLLRRDPGKAEEMVSHLAETFRLIIKSTRCDLVTLADELRLVESYLAIENLRFQDHLDVSIEIPPDSLDVLIPPLTLQPLVENSIKHGLRAGRDKHCGTIKVRAKKNDSHLLISVTDNGTGFDFRAREPNEVSGVGLGNVQERLLSSFGLESGIHIDTRVSKGSMVWFDIPVIHAGEAGRLQRPETEEQAPSAAELKTGENQNTWPQASIEGLPARYSASRR